MIRWSYTCETNAKECFFLLLHKVSLRKSYLLNNIFELFLFRWQQGRHNATSSHRSLLLTGAAEPTPTCTCRKEQLLSEIQNLKTPGWAEHGGMMAQSRRRESGLASGTGLPRQEGKDNSPATVVRRRGEHSPPCPDCGSGDNGSDARALNMRRRVRARPAAPCLREGRPRGLLRWLPGRRGQRGAAAGTGWGGAGQPLPPGLGGRMLGGGGADVNVLQRISAPPPFFFFFIIFLSNLTASPPPSACPLGCRATWFSANQPPIDASSCHPPHQCWRAKQSPSAVLPREPLPPAGTQQRTRGSCGGAGEDSFEHGRGGRAEPARDRRGPAAPPQPRPPALCPRTPFGAARAEPRPPPALSSGLAQHPASRRTSPRALPAPGPFPEPGRSPPPRPKPTPAPTLSLPP